MTSRDVVFDEENTWDWNRLQPTQVLFDNDSENSSEATPTATEILPIAAEATDTVAQSHRQIRKRPAWMYDYEVTGIDQSEDPLTHFVLF